MTTAWLRQCKAAAFDMVGAEAFAVLDDLKDNTAAVAREREYDLIGIAVSGDVGQALLGDAVEDELDVGVEFPELRTDLSVDGDPCSARECTRKVVDCTCES
jgi:hypothetical protein